MLCLVRAPIIIVFGGAYSSDEIMAPLVLEIKRRFPMSTVALFSPKTYGYDWWAPYEPSSEEIRWHWHGNRSWHDAYEHAHAQTRHADLEQLPMVLDIVRKKMRTIWLIQRRPLIVIGTSNGCVPAVEVATRHKAVGLWLASGVVAEQQQATLASFDGTTICTASWYDRYWRGPHWILWFTTSVAQHCDSLLWGNDPHIHKHACESCDAFAMDWAVAKLRCAIN